MPTNEEIRTALSEEIPKGEELSEALVDTIRNLFFGGDPTPLTKGEHRHDTASERFKDIRDQGFVSKYQELEEALTPGRTRRARLQSFKGCLELSVVKRSIEIYADYVAGGSAIEPVPGEGDKKTYSVHFSDNDELLKEEIKEVDDRLKLPSFAWNIVYDMCWAGEDWIEKVFMPEGMVRLQRLEKRNMFRNQLPDGRLDPEKPYSQLPEYGSVALRGVGEGGEVTFDAWQIQHFRMASELQSGYGESLLVSMVPQCNEIKLIEQGLTIARLTKAHRRLLWRLECGKLMGDDKETFIKKQKELLTKRSWIDPNNGQTRQGRNPILEEEDIFTDKNNEIAQIPGDSSVGQIQDVAHKYRYLLAGVRIPEAWLGLTGPNIRNVIDEQVLSFMRACRRIRGYFETGMAEIYFYALASYGISIDFLRERRLVFEWPSLTHHDDEAYVRMQMLRADLAAKYKGVMFLPDEAIMKAALGYDDDKVKETLEMMLKQRERTQQMQQRFGPPPGQQPPGPPQPDQGNGRPPYPPTPRLGRAGTREGMILSDYASELGEVLYGLADNDTELRADLDELKFCVEEMLGHISRSHQIPNTVPHIPSV